MRHAEQQRVYGVLVGSVKDGQIDPSGRTPHYEIWVQGNGMNYRVAVNVISQDGSEVMAYFDPDYTSPDPHKLDPAALASGAAGFAQLTTGPTGTGLDYLRDKLFPLDKMSVIPPEGAGVTLKNLLDGQIERAKADTGAVAIAFGESFQDPTPDQTFGFSPERGVHDIHMMQGDSGTFAGDDRVNGDGALFIRFTSGETAALFVRFSTQDISAAGGGA
ncbi:uncharacterized protein YukJ [Paraburkholderia sp. GAS448]|uniref:DUF2278 family protein n=1 Tax=Paraburkholderia sp. GAS448 TaxID=3035136 RepID=UPI003D251A56